LSSRVIGGPPPDSDPMVDPKDLNKLDEFLPVEEGEPPSIAEVESILTANFGLFRQNRIRIGLIGLGLVVLFAYLWTGARAGFPKIAPGSYIGSISIPDTKEIPSALKLYVERAPSDDELLFVVVRDGWLPQKVLPASQPGADGSFPITISGKDGSFRLEGRQIANGQYSGKVVYIDSGRVGSWSLNPITQNELQQSENETGEVRDWLVLQAGLFDAINRTSALGESLAKQKLEIDTLSGYVTEGGDLKARAEKKLDLIRRQQDDARQLLERKQKEAKELEDKIEIAESVTRMGKLVSLSRETVEREARWADSMLRSVGDYTVSDAPTSPGLPDPSAKIRQSIELERERISHLEQLLGKSGSNSEAR
jgi:hypothetical protein